MAAAAQQRLFAGSVKQLAAAVKVAANSYSDEALPQLKFKADDARARRDAAKLAAEKAFHGHSVAGVGAEAWRTLWEAARHYAEHTAYPGRAFPPEQDKVCVLCQQPLNAAARARMGSFETFIRADPEARAGVAEDGYARALKAYRAKRISVGAAAETRRRIAIENPSLAKNVVRFLASARLRG